MITSKARYVNLVYKNIYLLVISGISAHWETLISQTMRQGRVITKRDDRGNRRSIHSIFPSWRRKKVTEKENIREEIVRLNYPTLFRSNARMSLTNFVNDSCDPVVSRDCFLAQFRLRSDRFPSKIENVLPHQS